LILIKRLSNTNPIGLTNRSLDIDQVPRCLVLPFPGVNFTNILQEAFMHADPKSAKKTAGLTVFFGAFEKETYKSFA